MTWKTVALVVVLTVVPGLAFAQGPPTPTSPPHPSMPWSGLPYSGGTGYGNVIRYIQVPPQQVERSEGTRLNSSHIQKSRMPSSA